MSFGAGYTLENMEDMRNIEYIMLLKCLGAYNKRMEREAKSSGGSQFHDKEGIRRSGL